MSLPSGDQPTAIAWSGSDACHLRISFGGVFPNMYVILIGLVGWAESSRPTVRQHAQPVGLEDSAHPTRLCRPSSRQTRPEPADQLLAVQVAADDDELVHPRVRAPRPVGA